MDETTKPKLAFAYQGWDMLPQRHEFGDVVIPASVQDTPDVAPSRPPIQRLVPHVTQTIHQARIKKRWTVDELARRVNVSVDDIYSFEAGQKFPNAHVIQNLQAALGVSLIPRE